VFGRGSRSSISAPPQSRIGPGIGEIDEEGDDDDGEDQQHDHELDDDQVALGDRLEDQPAEAGQIEDVLDDDRRRRAGRRIAGR
jgi:hypothetical protein